MTTVLLVAQPGGYRVSWLTGAAAATALWASALSLLLLVQGSLHLPELAGLDVLHAGVCTAAALSLGGARRGGSATPLTKLAIMLALAGVAWGLLASWSFDPGSAALDSVYATIVLLAAVGTVGLASAWRSAEGEQRARMRVLAVASASVFAAHVLVYAQALLVGEPQPLAWNARGVVVAVIGPLIVLALRRDSQPDRQLEVSRKAAVYAASIAVLTAYFLMVIVGGSLLGSAGGVLGAALQVAFSALAVAALAVVLLSKAVKAHLRVFVTKHLFKNKYDYRAEWLRLTERLGEADEPAALASRALSAMAGIIRSNDGALWLSTGGGRYEWIASIQTRTADLSYDRGHPLPTFLAARRWVIDSDEYRERPEHYGSAFGDPADGMLPPSSIIVPLEFQGRLEGFVVLAKPRGVSALNFEDHDILKTAGRQIAVVLVHAVAQKQLTETRQFEAVNKLSIFLMHDLKNLIAQQELVVANAQRFRNRPEFVDDSIATIRAGVQRMKRLLEQLRGSGFRRPSSSRAEASRVVIDVESRCADRKPAPLAELAEAPVWVGMDREELLNCITHLVRNAQDATPLDGKITVRLARAGHFAFISVTDTGHGMDEAFIRNRLFTPFDSTKGAKGMGIGAYQVKEAVTAAGGEVTVKSAPGAGTTFELKIPCVLQPSHSVRLDESVA
jgi:putative PEP-CTERM system histidine kinase